MHVGPSRGSPPPTAHMLLCATIHAVTPPSTDAAGAHWPQHPPPCRVRPSPMQNVSGTPSSPAAAIRRAKSSLLASAPRSSSSTTRSRGPIAATTWSRGRRASGRGRHVAVRVRTAGQGVQLEGPRWGVHVSQCARAAAHPSPHATPREGAARLGRLCRLCHLDVLCAQGVGLEGDHLGAGVAPGVVGCRVSGGCEAMRPSCASAARPCAWRLQQGLPCGRAIICGSHQVPATPRT